MTNAAHARRSWRTAPEQLRESSPLPRIEEAAPYHLRDATAELIAGWTAPVIPESVLEAEARAYLHSPVRRTATFVTWLVARGF